MSPSPTIHTTGFKVNDCPHKYDRFDSPDVKTVLKKLQEASCGGGSVTIPHKEPLLAKMNEKSEAAVAIGAVNTITKTADKKLRGDNTDWLGIKNQLEARLPNSTGEGLTFLLIGAGGTARAAAYAFKQMGAKRVLIHNRTLKRSEALAKEFGLEVCKQLKDLVMLPELHVVVCTLPGSVEFTMPDIKVLEANKPLVLEASYIPRRTAFFKQALEAGCEVIEGIEMLFEQGCAQCEIWTGKPAPRKEIAQALIEALFTAGSEHPAFANMEPHNEIPVALSREASSLWSFCSIL
eukprot:CAMPEP_0170641036 /NCGR_PEP_ID=MMETSP0224-20130122/40547_1 /TAXON_ID=285029 /ORGANISM="Togula jolla, Strain CCCM 725" /LENGTH=292 /DNA_ID=CAMNT_0010971589 /DNA_START=116 /DNA_END=994 /DNA_ORIENTATION=-